MEKKKTEDSFSLFNSVGGIITTIITVGSCLFGIGWAIGSALTGWLLAFFGFKANEVQSMEAIHGIKMFLSWLPAAGTALSVIFISFYPLTETKMKRITEELVRRRK